MIVSVTPEADRELTEGAVFYAREGGGEVGTAFIAEYERAIIARRRLSTSPPQARLLD